MITVSVAFGPKRDKLVPARADTSHLASLGALRIDCMECGGDGDWGKFLFEGEGAEDYAASFGISLPYVRGTYNCAVCKGTGKVYVGG